MHVWWAVTKPDARLMSPTWLILTLSLLPAIIVGLRKMPRIVRRVIARRVSFSGIINTVESSERGHLYRALEHGESPVRLKTFETIDVVSLCVNCDD